MGIDVVRTVDDLRAWVKARQKDGKRVGLVPTMGALHDGHLSLVQTVIDHGAIAIATLFVNPKQFGPNEDLGTYPRDEVRDADKLEKAGARLLFAPDIGEIYPDGFSTSVTVAGLGDILEGEYRPGFFTGVATVVSKLLIQALPDVAVFGEKDFQQLQVIRRLVIDLNIPVEIIGGVTIREADGLAMSSRNVYLTADERVRAPILCQTLRAIAKAIEAGSKVDDYVSWGRHELLRSGFQQVDYVAICDAETLSIYDDHSRPGRVLAAAKLGKARLIDNVPIVAQH